MKALQLHGPGDLRLDEVADPRPGLADVVVRVLACGICGSDISYVRTGGVSGPVSAPIGLGHELAGVVEQVGDEVRGIAPGVRVVVNPMADGNAIGAGAPEGAFAPRLLVRNATLGASLHRIPDHVGIERAALAEPLSVALHAVNRSGARAGVKAAVFGAGPIGLGVVLFLRRRGVEDVAVIDLSDARLERAAALGATLTINPRHDDVRAKLAQAHGAGEIFGWPFVETDVFFEVSGGRGVINDVVELARFQAELMVVAVHHEPVEVNFLKALGKEMTIRTSMAYPDEFADVMATLADPDLDVSPLVSHRFPLEAFQQAFDVAQDRDQSAKVLITFDAQAAPG